MNYDQYETRGWIQADDACAAANLTIACSTLDKYCDEIGCNEYKAPIIYTDILRYVLWVNWSISLIMTLGGITYMYSKWVTVSNTLNAGKRWSYKHSDKNTSQRLALQYDRLQSPDREIKRNYTTTVSKLDLNSWYSNSKLSDLSSLDYS